ncbi:MAG: hypothetical protein U1F70_09125 [Candidatus Competibacteraceae bacterium]
MPKFIWSDYIQYRVQLRGFDISKIEEILRFSDERYFDTVTQRMVAVGKYNKLLIMIPYDQTKNESEDAITPVTVHATSRQQIKFRLVSGRFLK